MIDRRRLPEDVRKGRSSLRLLCFCLILTLTVAGCTLPEPPGDYAWDTHLTVPLGVRTYGLIELTKPDSALEAEGSGIGMEQDSILFFSNWNHTAVALRDSIRVDAYTDTLIKPPQLSDTTGTFILPPQRHSLVSGRISRGSARVRVFNLTTATPESAIVTMPNIVVDQFGTPLRIRSAAGETPYDTTISLVGDSLLLPEVSPQYVRIRLQGPAGVTMMAIVEVTSLTFSYYQGVFDHLEINGTESGQRVEPIPEGWENVHPTTVDAFIHIEHSLPVNAAAHVNVRTWLGGSVVEQSALDVPTIDLGVDTTVTIHNLADLVNIWPDSVSAVATVILNGPVRSLVNDSVRIDVELRAPLEVVLGPVHDAGDVARVAAEQFEDVLEGTAQIRIWNRLPIGGHVYLVVDEDSSAVLPESVADVDTLIDRQIPVSIVSNGRATSEAYDEFSFALNERILSLFRTPHFFLRTDVFLAGSDGDTIVAHAADYVKIQIIADLNYRIDTEGE